MSSKSQAEQFSLSEQLAALGLPRADKQPARSSKQEQDRFRRSLAEFRHQDRTQAFVAYIFRQLGVPSSEELDERVNIATSNVQSLGLEDQVRVGETLPANSPIQSALTELDNLINEFYGVVYDGELHYSKAITLFTIEQALAERTGGNGEDQPPVSETSPAA